MPNGGFAGGLAGGLMSGLQVGQQFSQTGLAVAKIKAAQQAAALDAKKFELDYWKAAEPRFDEAISITDPQDRALTFKMLFADAEAKVGEVPPALKDLFKQDPEKIRAQLGEIREQGLTLGEVALYARNPGAAAVAFTALAKRLRTKEQAAAISGTRGEGDDTGPGLTDPTAGVATAPGMEAAAEFARQRIAQMRKNLEIATDRGANPRSLAALQEAITKAEQGLDAMTTGFALSGAEQARAPITGVSESVARELNVVPGVTSLGEARQQTAPTGGTPAAPAVSGTAPRAAAPGGAPRLRTPQQVLADERRAKPVAQVFDPDTAREALRAGHKTVGEAEDAGFAPMSAEEAARRKAAGTAGEQMAKDQEDRWAKAADTAQDMRVAYSAMYNALRRAGPTGKLTDAIRQPIYQFASLLGVDTKRLAAMEEVRSLQIFLATQVLKDFTGNDSDREFLAAIEKSPGLGKQPEANERLLRVAVKSAGMQVERNQYAAAWRSKYGSSTSKNPDGFTFQQYWDAYRNLPQHRIVDPSSWKDR